MQHGDNSQQAAVTPQQPAPVIVGMARSGTTLLRMMLDANSQLAIPPETNFGPALDAFERQGAGAAARAAVRSQAWGDFNISGGEFIQLVDDAQPGSFGDFLRIFYRLYAELQGKPRWGDKSPYYVTRMSAIHTHLPEARFIHIVRDGRDVALSLQPLWFGPSAPADIARWWVRTLESARHQGEGLAHYMEVRYESLVLEPVPTLQRICEFVELEWEESMLDYHRAASRRLAAETVDRELPDRVVPRAERLGIHELIGRPPQADRVERWRREMSAADRDAFESVAAETLKAYGYALGPLGSPG
jgi:hypothetical protein